MEAARRTIDSWRSDLLARDPAGFIVEHLESLATSALAFARAMEFGFLLDGQRKLLSIGYRATDGTLDPSCYDLLASEARLASFIAIAKGDVAARHWFHSLGIPGVMRGMAAAVHLIPVSHTNWCSVHALDTEVKRQYGGSVRTNWIAI